jgi:DNA-binding MarR family transcriptional regulator
MPLSFVDLQPAEAVARARKAVTQGDGEALSSLDRHFRHTFLGLVQDRAGALETLREALLTACHWVERENREPWRTQWSYLLELLQDAEAAPALADLRALGAAEGRAAEVLKTLVSESRPLRPHEIAERLRISAQQVANVCRRLESAELIVRRQEGGRATWISPTRRGARFVALLPPAGPGRAQGSFSPRTDPEIGALYSRIRELLARSMEEPALKSEIEPLVRRLRTLQDQEADELERRFKARLHLQPGTGWQALERAEKLLEK